MLLACPTCDTCFRVPAGAIAGAGRQVRCAGCGAVWQATPADLLEEAAAEPAWTEAPEPPAPTPPAPSRPPPPPPVAAPAPAASADAPFDVLTPELALADALLEAVMDPGGTPRRGAVPAADELLADAPPLVPELAEDDGSRPELDHDGSQAGDPNVGTVARRPSRLRRHAKASKTTLALRGAVAALSVVLATLLVARADLVRFDPGLAGLYAGLGLPVNLRGIELHEVQALREAKEGVPMLLIQGYVFNPGPKSAEVPKLRLAVLAASGRELYAWTAAPQATNLGGGEGFRFSSRLASPPQESRDVVVRFLHRRDLAYETR